MGKNESKAPELAGGGGVTARTVCLACRTELFPTQKVLKQARALDLSLGRWNYPVPSSEKLTFTSLLSQPTSPQLLWPSVLLAV